MVCAVPLAFSSEIYEPAWVPKLLALHLCVALACLGWLLQTRRRQDLCPISSPLLPPALCLMGIALLSALGTPHPPEAMAKLLNQATLLVLLWVVANALSTEQFRPMLWSSALTGLAVALIGVLQYHGLAFLGIPSAAPPSATFVNRNFAAEYLICAIPLSGLLFLTARRQVVLLVSGLSTALMSVYLVYTRTRSAWVGLAGALLCVGGLLALSSGLRRPALETLRGLMDRRKRMLAWGFFALFAFLSALPAPRAALPEAKANLAATAASLFQQDAIKDASITERLTFWGNTLRMVADHPLLGVGIGGWARVYPLYDRGVAISTKASVSQTHNDYLCIASEYGLIGLGVYLWFLIVGFGCLLKMARSPSPFSHIAALMFALSLLSILGDALFAFPKDQPHAVMFPYLLFGLAAGATARRRTTPGLSTTHILVPVILLVISLGALELTRRRVGFDQRYLRAVIQGGSRNWPALLKEAQAALQYGTFRPHILVLKGDALKNLRRDGEAEAAYRQALAYAPHVWETHERLGSLYVQQGRLEEALLHCQTALSLCPSTLDSRNNLGVIYLQKRDFDRAEESFRTVLRASPNSAGAYLNLGNTHAARGQLDSALVCYQKAAALQPDLAQAHVALGNVSYTLSHYPEALSAYQSFLKLEKGDQTLSRFVKERIVLCERQLKQRVP